MAMSLQDLAGRRFGPVTFEVSRSRVAEFVGATGDDPDRWERHAPPGFAAAALFSIAPVLLSDEAVRPAARTVVHNEQLFTWHRPLAIGESLEVAGTVAGVRSRTGLNVVDFRAEAGDGRPWLSSASTFLLSDRAAAVSEEEPEPAHDERGPCDPPQRGPLPPEGGAVEPLRRSASRADLVRYAGATGDWNPIHWDHDAARAAGLPGIVVHGLLMMSWLAQAAGRYGADPAPLGELRARFRSPLRPGVPAEVTGSVSGTGPGEAELWMELRADETRLVTARARVTP